ncbi:restriction endonuclease subunit S [Corynebacterium marquesiae]|uniref:restriction endonuclease subunit S n=1 Tax=Corynebacterium marquesiae TaxID=2913503 RepID=UPI0038D02951
MSEQQMYFSPAELDRLALQKDDVVIVEGGAGYGRSAYLDDDLDGWGFQNSIVRVRPYPEVSLGRYVYYALQHAQADRQIELEVSTATLPHFTAEKVGRFRLPLPPLETQRAIADYLDRETAEIDSMRADLDEMERLLTERRRSVVTSFTASDECETVSLRSLAAATGGLISDGDWVELKDQDPNGEVRLLQLADVGDGCFRDKSDKWVNDNVFDLLECTALQQGDVLIARMPDPIARATLVPAFDYRSITVVDVAILRVPSSDDPAFVMHAINSAAFRSSVESKLSGSTRQRVSRSVLGREVIPRPDLPTQRRIADEIDRETAEIDSMLEDITKLRDLLAERRAAVISAAVTGQIDIPVSPTHKDEPHA